MSLCLTYGKTAAQKQKELIEFASGKESILYSKPSTLLLHVRELFGDSKEALEQAVLLNCLPWKPTMLWKHTCSPITSVSASPVDTPTAGPAEETPAPAMAAVAKPSSNAPYLCFVHARYGTKAYSCRSSKCPMRDQVQGWLPAL